VAALGACYCATNRAAKSREFLATTLAALETKLKRGDANPHLVYVRGQLGLTLLHEGRWEEAEAMLRRAFAEYDHPELRRLNLRLHPLQRVTSGLGQALAAQGKFAEAAPFVVSAFQELHANEHRIAGNRSAMVREAFDAVIALYTAWGKPDQVTEWKTKFSDTDSTSRQPVSLSPKKI
jgi:tetratricopeptide (TPR) repeat protein